MDKMTDPACAGLKKYTYAEHRCNFEKWVQTKTSEGRRFDFAAWAAANAARMGAGIWLTDDEAYEILEETGFDGLAKYGVKWLPDPGRLRYETSRLVQ